jgi:hypothetical protein
MAVEIELDVDASGATGSIGQVAASLKGLEMIANDIDIDIDADLSDITEEINSFTDALDGIDTGNFNFVQDLDNVADKLDEALEKEIDVDVSGNVNNSNSTGSDPPKTSDLTFNVPRFLDDDENITTADGSGSAHPLLRRIKQIEERNGLDYGEVRGFWNRDSDLQTLQKDFHNAVQQREHPAANLDIPSELIDGDLELGVDRGFGLEGPDMTGRRKHWLSSSEIEEMKNLDLGSDDSDTDFSETRERFADLYGGDFMQQQDLDPLGMKPGRLKSLQNLNNIETGLEREDMLRAIGKRGEFGTESVSQIRTRMGQLSDEELADVRGATPGFTDYESDGLFPRSKGDGINLKTAKKVGSELKEEFGDLGSVLRKVRPTMGKYMQLLAALIPVAVALGAQVLGLAAAMGSVAVAGGAILGLGLIGHADSMAGSVQNAKQEFRELKGELFETFQPAAQEFAPIQSEFFDRAPDMLSGVADEIEGFTQFDDTLFDLGEAFGGGLEEVAEIINENGESVSQLTERFAGLIGSGAIEFFQWMLRMIAENQELMSGLGRDVMKLAVVAYNLSMVIAKLVVIFSPLFDLLVFISNLLNNELFLGLLTVISAMLVLGKTVSVLYGLVTGFSALSTIVSNAMLMMMGYEMTALQATAATLGLAAAVGVLTAGLSVLAGMAISSGVIGPSISARNYDEGVGGSGGNVYNDNRTVNIDASGSSDYASEKAIGDTVRREMERESAMQTPDGGGNTSRSSEENDGWF